MVLINTCLEILSSKSPKKSLEQFRELNKGKGGMLINEIEKKYRTRISHSDCQKLQICQYLISRATNIFESLNQLSSVLQTKVIRPVIIKLPYFIILHWALL